MNSSGLWSSLESSKSTITQSVSRSLVGWYTIVDGRAFPVCAWSEQTGRETETEVEPFLVEYANDCRSGGGLVSIWETATGRMNEGDKLCRIFRIIE